MHTLKYRSWQLVSLSNNYNDPLGRRHRLKHGILRWIY